MTKSTIKNTPNPTSSGSGEGKHDLIDRQAALDALAVYIHLIDKTMGKGILTDDDCMAAAKSVLGEDEIPAIQPDHNADIGKKVEGDCISRQMAIEAVKEELESGTYFDIPSKIEALPTAHTEIIRCKDCIWYELPSHRITENCVRWMKSNGILLPIKPNDYCSYAERRSD